MEIDIALSEEEEIESLTPIQLQEWIIGINLPISTFELEVKSK